MADAGIKIKQLRDWMAPQKLDAYLVPHADRFQSEFPAPSENRIEWLTGFTGSHGMAAVLKDKAALFTSGIYTIQARRQIDTSLYDIVEAPPASPLTWLQKNLGKNAVIGFDPELFTVTQIELWRKASTNEGWNFLPVTENAIDLFWERPREAIAPAWAHNVEFSGRATEDKIADLVNKMSADAFHLLITEPALVCWLLNMRGSDITHTPLVHSLALVDEDGQVTLFIEPEKVTPELRASWGNHVGVEPFSRLYDILLKINKPLQLDPAQAPYAVKSFCKKNNIRVIEAVDPAIYLRSAKNETEIRGAFKAHELDVQAFVEFSEWLHSRDFSKEKITELDVIQRLHEARMANSECVEDSFDTIAGYGPNGAVIHYRATEETNLRLEEGSLLLLDSGGQYRFGTTDVTRVYAIGEPTAQMKLHYTTVLKSVIALSTTRFPAETIGARLDSIARAPIWALGLDYSHGTGHGVGSYLSVHEGPVRITPANMHPMAGGIIRPGMILSIEPGIYLEGQYGIRLENLVVVVEDKRPGDVKDMLAFKTLTKVPFEVNLIDYSLLDDKEKEFLKDFN